MELGNPFRNLSKEIFSLDNTTAMDEESVKNMMMIEKIGNDLFASYVDQRLIKKNISIYSPIAKNKLRLFASSKKTSKPNSMLRTFKNDVDLFSKLFIISMNRDLDLDQFFAFENQPCPPSISLYGEMRTGNKAVLVTCLIKLLSKHSEEIGWNNLEQKVSDLDDLDVTEELNDNDDYESSQATENYEASQAASSSENEDDRTYSAIIYDGSALVHILDPKSKTSFSEYSNSIWHDHIIRSAHKHRAHRIDIVWDVYNALSTKQHTRDTRGCGLRIQVRPNTQLPKNWNNFLRNQINTTELFTLLSEDIISSSRFQAIEVVATKKIGVLFLILATTTVLFNLATMKRQILAFFST